MHVPLRGQFKHWGKLAMMTLEKRSQFYLTSLNQHYNAWLTAVGHKESNKSSPMDTLEFRSSPPLHSFAISVNSVILAVRQPSQID